MTFGQGVEITSRQTDTLPDFSYALLNNIPEDPFAFHMLSHPFRGDNFAMTPLPQQNHLPGLFCKLEYQLESKSKLAPRFRLGSLNYTEWMEGKKDFYTRYYK